MLLFLCQLQGKPSHGSKGGSQTDQVSAYFAIKFPCTAFIADFLRLVLCSVVHSKNKCSAGKFYCKICRNLACEPHYSVCYKESHHGRYNLRWWTRLKDSPHIHLAWPQTTTTGALLYHIWPGLKWGHLCITPGLLSNHHHGGTSVSHYPRGPHPRGYGSVINIG